MQVEVMKNILGANDEIAQSNRDLFSQKNIFVLNLMGSPGAGKTSVLEKSLAILKSEMQIAIIEGDLFTAKDAERIDRIGVPVFQINTAGGCHLDAPMIRKAIDKLDLDALDLLIIENVGNLVCPAEFELGESKKAVILSIAEGDDKPAKYPLIFKESELILLNKIDLLPYVNFDLERVKKDLSRMNPLAKILETSATSGAGIDEFCGWIRGQIQ
ncbi:MAG: hydrogenase nickel incorporation protein HypB [Selenomonadaceae bacterium]|nr:hydrogenase nickel incorporation protein HypB [Selenomonadaceae bacterium]